MEIMKTCCTCKTEKSYGEYHKSSKTKDGYSNCCKVCRKLIDAKSYKKSPTRQLKVKATRAQTLKHNRMLVARYKRMCGCLVCGEKEPACLDLHHLDPSQKEQDPSRMLSYGTPSLKREIRKCVVLCANDHRKFHAGLIELPLVSVNGKPTLL